MKKQKIKERCHLCGSLFRDTKKLTRHTGGISFDVCDRTLCREESEELGRVISAIAERYRKIRNEYGLFDHTIKEIRLDREETERMLARCAEKLTSL